MKRFLSLVLVFALLVCGMPISASATTIGQQDPDSGISRYTVLVLDTSGTTIFLGPGGEAYTVDAALEYAQKAASCFLSDIRKSSDENQVAIVSYKDTAAIVSDFSDDYDALEAEIYNLEASSVTRDIAAGLQAADDLLSSVTDENAIKNVVLFTSGMTNCGEYNYSGHYDLDTVGSDWK